MYISENFIKIMCFFSSYVYLCLNIKYVASKLQKNWLHVTLTLFVYLPIFQISKQSLT